MIFCYKIAVLVVSLHPVGVFAGQLVAFFLRQIRCPQLWPRYLPFLDCPVLVWVGLPCPPFCGAPSERGRSHHWAGCTGRWLSVLVWSLMRLMMPGPSGLVFVCVVRRAAATSLVFIRSSICGIFIICRACVSGCLCGLRSLCWFAICGFHCRVQWLSRPSLHLCLA